MRKTSSGDRKIIKLRISKETLHRLTQRELEKVAAMISSPSICTETTNQCCVTL